MDSRSAIVWLVRYARFLVLVVAPGTTLRADEPAAVFFRGINLNGPAVTIDGHMTVEAIGLLFGLDMFGKTFAPLAYNRWRQRLHPEKPGSRLLLDKLTREQADSIIRSFAARDDCQSGGPRTQNRARARDG